MALLVLGLVVLVLCLWRLGLDRADKLASVVSAICAFIAVAFSLYTLLDFRRPPPARRDRLQTTNKEKTNFDAADRREINIRANAIGHSRIYQVGEGIQEITEK